MTVAHYKGGHHPGNDLGLHYTALPPIVASCPYSDQLLVTRKFWSPGANRPSQANQLLAAWHRLAGEDAALGLGDDALDQRQIMPDLAEPELGLDRGACGQRLHGALKRAHGGAGGCDQFPVQLCFLCFAPAVLDGE